MAELLASSTANAVSADFTLIDGQSTLLLLKDAIGEAVCPDAVARIQVKSGTKYFTIGMLDVTNPARVLQAPGTFRVVKFPSTAAFGVDND